MNERELLEAAAKAAGIPGNYNEEFRTFWIAEHLRGDEDGASFARARLGLARQNRIWWDPRHDDGDALRLAVALKLQITPGTYREDEATAFHAGIGEAHERTHYRQDIYTATRRAIVRVAAEIGKRASRQ